MSNFPAFSPVPAESLEAANEEIRRLKADLTESVLALERLVIFCEQLCEDTCISIHYPSADWARQIVRKHEIKIDKP